jgi:hypothetical protein
MSTLHINPMILQTAEFYHADDLVIEFFTQYENETANLRFRGRLDDYWASNKTVSKTKLGDVVNITYSLLKLGNHEKKWILEIKTID